MNKICWRDFYTGFATGASVVLIVMVCVLPGLLRGNTETVTSTDTSTVAESTPNTEEDEADLKMYNTSIKDWSVSVEDGTELQFKTPTDWYSLADQYQDGLVEYYGKELPDTGIVCVGDNTDQYNATMIINARPLSDVKEVLQTIYDEEFNEEEMLFSDTYHFMKDGTVPEDTMVEELDSIEANGHTYRIFKHGFDTEYYTDEEQTETTTVHTDELVGYSDTDDVVEIIMYMSEFDQEKGVAALREFLGAEE